MEREFITKAICLKSIDYKEKDKQLILFSVTNGLITAVLKGCKSPKAKLKFASNPFCFAEYSIVQKGDFYTITNASQIDSFFDITQDYENYTLACLMLDITSHVVRFNEPNVQLFVTLVKALKSVCYEKISAKMVFVKFALFVLEIIGYKLDFNKCQRCELNFMFEKFLDLASGEIVCPNCKTISSVKISNACFSALKIIASTEIERFNTIKLPPASLTEAINLLVENIEARLERKIASKKLLQTI